MLWPIIIYICLLASAANGQKQRPAFHTRHLDDDFTFNWHIEPAQVLFEVHARTTGWFALGLSPNGAMASSDVMIGWIDDLSGEARLRDAFIGERPPPTEDDQQDLTLIGGRQNETHVFFQWRRKLRTCDEQGDRAITNDTIRLIWAIGESDPVGSSLDGTPQHSKRGGVSLALRPAKSAQRLASDRAAFERDLDVTWQFRMENVSVGKVDTLYWCKLFKLPARADTPLQQIGARTVVEPIGNTPHVHHLILYLCDATVDEQLVGESGKEFDCSTEENYMSKCNSEMLYGWAYGSPDEIYPSFLGAQRDANLEGRYAMIEMHYDNPTMRSDIVDSSGVDVFLTRRKREKEAGILMLAVSTSWNIVVPPRQKEFKISSNCHSECTDKFLPQDDDGIQVDAVFGHTHLLGKKVVVRHIRGDTELPPLYRDDHYDFNFQETRQVTPRRVLRGDRLVLECHYSSLEPTTRDNVTFGGNPTRNEMCLAIMRYYPNVGFSTCGSEPEANALLAAADLDDAKIQQMYEEVAKISNDTDGDKLKSAVPIEQRFSAVDWSDEEKVERLQSVYDDARATFYCIKHKESGKAKFHYGSEVFSKDFQPFEKSAEELACPHMD